MKRWLILILFVLLAGACAPAAPSDEVAMMRLTQSAVERTATENARQTAVYAAAATRDVQGLIDATERAHQEALTVFQERRAAAAATLAAADIAVIQAEGTRTALPPQIERTRAETQRLQVWTWAWPGLALAIIVGVVALVYLALRPRLRDRASAARSNELQAELAGVKIVDGAVIIADDAAVSVRRLAEGISQAIPRPVDDSLVAAYIDGWGRALEMFVGWLRVLPREKRTRDAMEAAGVVTAHGWNTLVDCLRRMGALERDGKGYRPVLDRAEVRARAVQVIPPFDRDRPALPPEVAPVTNYAQAATVER